MSKTRNSGPNAQKVLQSSGIKVITAVSGRAEEALSKYKSKMN
ncbi:NifB/NifX family molybdenum-iron cluster-binding protein [Acidobacteriota bacterium]